MVGSGVGSVVAVRIVVVGGLAVAATVAVGGPAAGGVMVVVPDVDMGRIVVEGFGVIVHEGEGNLFEAPHGADTAVVIPTNGVTDRQGNAVMGKGVAKAARDLWPRLPAELGEHLRDAGNRVHRLTFQDGARILFRINGDPAPYHVLSFPTKHHWRYPSTLELICKSLFELHATLYGCVSGVYMPRVGCGAGGLTWNEVRPYIEAVELPIIVRHLEV